MSPWTNKYPCKKHPDSYDGPYGGACVWCSRQMPAVNTPHLAKDEQVKLSMQTGQEITDKDDLKRYNEINGTRCAERGEKSEIARQDLKEWVADGGEKKYGKNLPESCRPAKPKNPVDIRQIYREISESDQYKRPRTEE